MSRDFERLAPNRPYDRVRRETAAFKRRNSGEGALETSSIWVDSVGIEPLRILVFDIAPIQNMALLIAVGHHQSAQVESEVDTSAERFKRLYPGLTAMSMNRGR